MFVPNYSFKHFVFLPHFPAKKVPSVGAWFHSFSTRDRFTFATGAYFYSKQFEITWRDNFPSNVNPTSPLCARVVHFVRVQRPGREREMICPPQTSLLYISGQSPIWIHTTATWARSHLRSRCIISGRHIWILKQLLLRQAGWPNYSRLADPLSKRIAFGRLKTRSETHFDRRK